jgi:ferritin-like metal-binding protein YciE
MEQTATTNRENFNVHSNSKLQEFFIDQLKDIYWAEQKLVKTLPKLQEAATSNELKTAFGNHLIETESHVSRLEQIFSSLGEQPEGVKCAAMAGIVDEGEDIIDETDKGTSQRDVGLIFAGQKAEHYEIASYGGMIKLGQTLGYSDVVSLLNQTLEEEKKADELLSSIAENGVNERALSEVNED